MGLYDGHWNDQNGDTVARGYVVEYDPPYVLTAVIT